MTSIISVTIVAAFIIIVLIIAKKDNEEARELVSNLTEEQKNKLMITDVKFVDKNAFIQQAMVVKLKDKGNNVRLRLLWFNKVIHNNEYNKITIADATIKKSEQEEHNLKYGDFVKLYSAPKKSIGRTKIIWD